MYSIRAANRGSKTARGRLGVTRHPEANNGLRGLSAQEISLPVLVAVGVVLVYFFRGTVLPWFIGIRFDALVGLNLASLVVAVAVCLTGGFKIRAAWILVLAAFGLSISQAEQLLNSGSRWFGLVLLVLALGPVFDNAVSRSLRRAAWIFTHQGLNILAAVFVGWYALGLPNFGAGYFSAFMNQCMLAGPIAGLGGAFSLARYLSTGSKFHVGLSILALVPVLASSSRIALLSTMVAYCTILIRRRPRIGILAGGLAAVALAFYVMAPERSDDRSGVTGAISAKGIENTRADLWESRIREFLGSPVLGIGVAMGTGGGSAVEGNGSIRVEPGSSYLAILAMTGLVGSLTFGAALFSTLNTYRRRSRLCLDRDLEITMGVFLAVHGIAEGWILSFGSPLAMLFWLWLGRVADIATPAVPRKRALASRSAPRQIRPSAGVPTI